MVNGACGHPSQQLYTFEIHEMVGLLLAFPCLSILLRNMPNERGRPHSRCMLLHIMSRVGMSRVGAG